MLRRKLFLAVFITSLLLVVTVGLLSESGQTKNNSSELQPFHQLDTSIITSGAQDAESNVMSSETTKVPQKEWYHNQVVVLTYHHVTDEQSGQHYVISPDQFARHMAFLHENDLHPITMADFLRFVETGQIATANAVLITFDDGYESYYTKAFPIMRAYGYPSVNFAIAGRLRDVSDRKRANMTPPLTIQQAKEMVATGLADIASHTYSLHEKEANNEWGELGPLTAPVYLEDMDRLEAEQEYRARLYVDFSMSRVGLSDWVGHPVEALSLPFGYANKIVLETARQAGYRYAFNSTPGVVTSKTDPFAIPRNDVGVRDMDEEKLHQLFTKAKNSFEGEHHEQSD